MSASPASRLDRLLAFIAADVSNLPLRKDAIREACDSGQWELARELIGNGLQISPEEAGLLGLAGYAHLQQQRYGDAEQVLAEALARGLDTPELHYNLAFALFMQQRYEQALEHLVAPLLPLALPLALLLRARCRHHLGRRSEAIDDCREYLQSEPDSAEAHGLLALLLHDDAQGVATVEHVQAALGRDPEQLEALLAQASMLFDAQERDVARPVFERIAQAHPDCGRAWLGLALVDLSHMQIDAARRGAELAAIHMPEHVGCWHVLAWIHLLSGATPAAQQAFERALAADRNFAESHGGLAIVAAMQGREDDAKQSIKRALRLDREAMSPQYALLLLLQRQGRDQEARAILDDFLARTARQGDMSYRDLVAAHQRYLRSRDQ